MDEENNSYSLRTIVLWIVIGFLFLFAMTGLVKNPVMYSFLILFFLVLAVADHYDSG